MLLSGPGKHPEVEIVYDENKPRSGVFINPQILAGHSSCPHQACVAGIAGGMENSGFRWWIHDVMVISVRPDNAHKITGRLALKCRTNTCHNVLRMITRQS